MDPWQSGLAVKIRIDGSRVQFPREAFDTVNPARLSKNRFHWILQTIAFILSVSRNFVSKSTQIDSLIDASKIMLKILNFGIFPFILCDHLLFLFLFSSGGVGRTGVFITVANTIDKLRTNNIIDIFHTIRQLRLQRCAMVQTLVSVESCRMLCFLL